MEQKEEDGEKKLLIDSLVGRTGAIIQIEWNPFPSIGSALFCWLVSSRAGLVNRTAIDNNNEFQEQH